MKLGILSLASLAFAATLLFSSHPAMAYSCHSSNGYYRSSDGSLVHGPKCGADLSGATAICRDGSHSFSHHHRGTCSRHHGVARWLN